MSVTKTKALISCAVIVLLICDFVFAYAKSRFPHNAAHMVGTKLLCLIRNLSKDYSNISVYYMYFKSCMLPSQASYLVNHLFISLQISNVTCLNNNGLLKMYCLKTVILKMSCQDSHLQQ